MSDLTLGIFILSFIVLGVFGDASDMELDDEKIVGGVNAKPNQRPFQISLRDAQTNRHFCGGAIISSRWVVTVAHCVRERKPTSFNIVAGSITLDVGGTKYSVQKSIPHPSYNKSTGENDIAMVRTTTTMAIFSRSIKVLPLTFHRVPQKETVIASGWGLTSFPGSVPNILQILPTLTINNTACEKLLAPARNLVFPSEMCVLTKIGQGLCYGDSGSPSTHKNKLAGLVSRGFPCARGLPDIITAISHHAGWILMTTMFN